MRTIQIDDEVYAYIKGQADAYEPDEEINTTLQRLFGLSRANMRGSEEISTAASESHRPLAFPTVRNRPLSRKSQKTDLETLVARGALSVGQALYLCDYQKKRVPGHEAQVTGRFLLYRDKHYSMSELAKQLLKGLGYQSDSVRGPMFWCTADGVTVKELWEKHLKRNGTH